MVETKLGGSGDDKIVAEKSSFLFASWWETWKISGNDGNDTIIGGEKNDFLYGNNGNDYIDGRNSNDRIYGGAGNDDLFGYTGDDHLFGNDGNDELFGEAGNDHVFGNSGNDELFGGTGNDFLGGFGFSASEFDTLTGGTGGDTFDLGNKDTVFYQGKGYATITDFDWEEGDRFQVAGSIGDYDLSTMDLSGGLSDDTLINYKGDLIAVVEDNTNVFLSQDFDFV